MQLIKYLSVFWCIVFIYQDTVAMLHMCMYDLINT